MPTEFQHQNLRGRSFKGKDLTGSTFKDADIRGANFAGAILVSTDFSNAKAGLKRSWSISLALGLILSIAVSDFLIAYTAAFFGSWLVNIETLAGQIFAGLFASILFAGFTLIIIFNGIGTPLLGFLGAVVSLVAVLSAGPGFNNTRASTILLAIIILITVAGVFAGAIAIGVARILFKAWMLPVMGLVALAATGAGSVSATGLIMDIAFLAWTFAIAIPVILSLIGLSWLASWRAIAGNRKYGLIRTLAVLLCSQGGTSFRGADLTDANFSNASLKHTDFRSAILTRTNWLQTKYLTQAQTTATYLSNPLIQQLAVTKQGADQNFDHLDLRGLNLQNANLADASLIGTKLSEANLQMADLSRAKLVQTQLYGANLTSATLTGAVIQDWSISADTKFEAVKCEYVYMQLPSKTDPDPCRKPDNRSEVFQDGDFADFMTPIVKTLDLYRTQHIDPRKIAYRFKTLDLFHHDGIDPTAAAIALKQLAEQHPEAELEVVALEGRGEDKVRLQARVAGATDRSVLSSEYFAKYQQISNLPYADLQSLLAGIAEKDERIRSLETMVMTAIESNKFYVETYYNLGDTVSEKGSININASGNVSGVVGGDIKEVNGVVNLGQIQGDVNNAIGQLAPSPDPSQTGLRELLMQLQTAIESEAELPTEDKAEALAQVKTLAEAGQNPEDNVLQKSAKTAMKILKGTIASLPDAAKLAESCANLLPAIASLLALV